ncbi:MAG: SRPBCC family protein [Ilumatobacteraceae bacterium]
MSLIVATIEIDRPADEVFAYATDPTRFAEWQKGVIDAKVAEPGNKIGTRCLTTRRIGFANRPVTAELTHIDPPKTWGVRGIDGPIRAIVDVTGKPMTEARARPTIEVAFTGHGIGSSSCHLLYDGKYARRCQSTSPPSST